MTNIEFTNGRWVKYETYRYDTSFTKEIYLGAIADENKEKLTVEQFKYYFDILLKFDSMYDIIGKENKEKFFNQVVNQINTWRRINY